MDSKPESLLEGFGPSRGYGSSLAGVYRGLPPFTPIG